MCVSRILPPPLPILICSALERVKVIAGIISKLEAFRKHNGRMRDGGLRKFSPATWLASYPRQKETSHANSSRENQKCNRQISLLLPAES